MGTRHGHVRWMLPPVALLASIGLGVVTARAEPGLAAPADVIVVFREGIDIARRNAILREAGAESRRHFRVIPATSARAGNPAVRQRLAAHPAVVGVSVNRALTLAGKPGSGGGGAGEVIPSGVARIGAPTAHLTATGAGVGVAVVDTGLDLDHPDLLIGTACFSAFGVSCDDDYGHGTRVGGIIGARKNGSGVLGVAPDARTRRT
jgi:subtilisin family serine protease